MPTAEWVAISVET